MHQLAVTGHRAADVAVLLCGQELQIHRIERDEPLIERLIALEAAFWAQVQQRRPPPTDGSDSCAQALKALYPRSTEQTLDLRQDLEGSQAFRELLQVRRTLESIQQREAELKHLLQSRLAQATRAVFDDGAISWKSSQDRLELDVAALLKDQPELLQRYGATRSGTRRFLVQPRRE
jgi:predicted phage-related endonuclease